MKKIPLFKSYIAPQAIWNVARLLVRSNYGAYLGEGPEVKAFEKEFAEKFALEHAVAVNSGSSALELAYELASINDGDEVIIPVMAHPATCLPATHRRAKIVFADIEEDLNVSVDDVRSKITPKTKALVFVHFGGNNRGLHELLEIAGESGIPVIEDAAQAIGSDFWGKADFTCVSLQAIKTLTSVDGGFLICKDKELHEKAKRLRWFGYDRGCKQKLGGLKEIDITEAGYKYHMNDVTASIGRGNLETIDKIISHRIKLAERYNRHPNVHAYIWLAIVNGIPFSEDVIKHFKRFGISIGQHHYRNDQYAVFGGRQALSEMDKLEKSYFLLPLHHGVSLHDVDHILKTLDAWNIVRHNHALQ